MARTEQLERCKLVTRTLELLRNRPKTLSLQKIEEDTGISQGYLAHIQSTKSDPGVTKIVALYEYLSKSELQLR